MLTPALLVALVALAGGLALAVFTRPDERLLTFASYGLHLAIAALLHAKAGFFSPDAELYHAQASQLAAYWAGDSAVAPRVTLGKEGWPSILALLYSVSGPAPSAGLVLNGIFSAACIPLIIRIASDLGASRKAAHRAALLMFLPPPMIWSVLLLREAGTWFFLLTALRGAITLNRSGEFRPRVLMILIGLAGAFAFRASIAIMFAGGIFIGLLFTRWVKAPLRVLLLTVGAAATPLLLSFVSKAAYTDSKSLQNSQAALGRSNSGFQSSNPIEGMLRASFGPFINELAGLSPIYAIDWIVWISVFGLALRSFYRHRPAIASLIPPLTILVALAISSGNYGTLVRLRVTALVLLLPLAALSLERMKTAAPTAPSHALKSKIRADGRVSRRPVRRKSTHVT